MSDKKVKRTPKQEVSEEVIEVSEEVIEESDTTEPETPKASLEDQLEELKNIIENVMSNMSENMKTMKILNNEVKKFSHKMKKDLKKNKKREKRKTNSEHGFNSPVAISDDLANFLNVPKGTKLRRPEVTSLINKYANEHNLKDPNNKAIFRPDSKLKKLLGPAEYPLKKNVDTKGYGIFNIQIYLKKHFLKAQQQEAK